MKGLPAFLVALVWGWSSLSTALAEPPQKLLLVGQAPDGNHKPGTHEYLADMEVLRLCLAAEETLEVEVALAGDDWPAGPEKIRTASAVVFSVLEGARWIQADARRHAAFVELASRGGGLVAWHWGCGGKDPKYIPAYLKLMGGCHGGPDRKYIFTKTSLAPAAHAPEMARGIGPFEVDDEFYYQLKWEQAEPAPQPVLEAQIMGTKQTVCWAWQRPDGGRSFGFTGGHAHANWKLPEYRRLATQAVLWSLKRPLPAAGLPADRFPAAFELPQAKAPAPR